LCVRLRLISGASRLGQQLVVWRVEGRGGSGLLARASRRRDQDGWKEQEKANREKVSESRRGRFTKRTENRPFQGVSAHNGVVTSGQHDTTAPAATKTTLQLEDRKEKKMKRRRWQDEEEEEGMARW